ncbi:MAG TPA: cellulase family glycosylhydrolase, partial [Micromonosporaceae bacterium]|nr:cellulase family glycosylhydrolase [Micromonosporaceae bacterium]
MKTKIGIALAAVGALIAAIFVAIQPAQAAVGIRVSNGVLVEGNGTPLKLRGINYPWNWYKWRSDTAAQFAAMKARGANSVRVVLSGGRWQPADTASDVATVIDLCKTNRLICVLENHDTTGYGEQQNEWTLDRAVDFWISVQSAMTGQENYVILNIGNEPIGNNNAAQWTQATVDAVQRLRNAGFDHTIMVDAPNWGQDWQFTMRDNAPTVHAADPTGNIIFSIHMYGVFDTAAEVTSYLDSFINRGLAIAIGEFGFNHSDGNPDEDAIMEAAEQRGIGYMGWSWSGNGCCVEYLDMVTNFDPNSPSSWGTRFFTGANGLSTTSQEATIFGGQTSNPQPPGTPGTPTASNVTSSSVTLTWSPSSGTVSNYEVDRCQGSNCTNFTQIATPTTNSYTDSGLSANTTYRYRVRATNSAGDSGNSGILTVTTTGGGSGGGCSATFNNVNQWSGGFQGEVTVTNTGSSNISGWTVTMNFANGQSLYQIWGG